VASGEKGENAVRYKIGLLCLLLAASLAYAQKLKTPAGPVHDSETAVRIAEAALVPVYGEKKIKSERPFLAELENDVWTVHGTLHCPDGEGGTTTHCAGGVAVVKISKADGRIISMAHYK
jgi:hypothetical protein